MCELSSLCFESLKLVPGDWGWVGRPPAPPWPSQVYSGPFQPCLLSLQCWDFFDECLHRHSYLLQLETSSIIWASKCCHPKGEIINSMYLGSSQALQQMWLSKASAVYLISALEWILHSSQRNWGFWVTCRMRLYHTDHYKPHVLWGPVSGKRDAPCRWVGSRNRA